MVQSCCSYFSCVFLPPLQFSCCYCCCFGSIQYVTVTIATCIDATACVAVVATAAVIAVATGNAGVAVAAGIATVVPAAAGIAAAFTIVVAVVAEVGEVSITPVLTYLFDKFR